MDRQVVTVEELNQMSRADVMRVASAYTEEELRKATAEYAQPLYDQVDPSPDDNFDDSIVVRAISERLAYSALMGVNDVIIERGVQFTAFEALAYASKKYAG